jgi:hypothetical protein
MLRQVLAILLSGGIALTADAQAPQNPLGGPDTGYSTKGAVVEDGTGAGLGYTAVCVLNSADSILVKFTWTSGNGSFFMDHLPAGKFILLVSNPEYADYVEEFQIDSASHDFGTIGLFQRAKLLAEVIVKGVAMGVRIKGDTTEFNASAYKVQPNAKVEDLIKQLPGLEVGKDGKITAMGQSVNKVLVDGEEFFGDDPTLVTRNIRADMVDKVQLYDKKSDQAAFTGVDDGKSVKTLNIQLRQDKKNGYFGRVEGGIGTDGYYSGQAMINSFKGDRKISAYGTIGNTGTVDLGWQDNGKYASSNVEMQGEGILIANGGWDELESFDGRYNGVGLPTSKTGGLHYDNKWDSGRQAININYKIGSMTVDGNQNIITQNNLPDQIQKSNSDQDFSNSIFRQKMNVTYQWQMDPTSALKVYLDGSLKNIKTANTYSSTTENQDSALLNDNARSLTTNGDQQTFDATALWTKRLGKPGRTLSAQVSYSNSNNTSTGYLYSNIHFYDSTGAVDSSQLIDQYKNNHVTGTLANANFTYSEPLSHSAALLLNYALGINNGTADRRSFVPSAPKEYNILDSLYSDNLTLNQFYNKEGVTFSYRKGKAILNAGTQVTSLNFEEKDLYTNTTYNRDFLYFTPQVMYMYQISGDQFFKFTYNGTNTLPTIDQVQPVQVNTDPLNVIVGNLDLKPSFANRFEAAFQAVRPGSMWHYYVDGIYTFTVRPIINNMQIDSNGSSIYQYQNLTGRMSTNAHLFLFAGKKIKKWDVNLESNFSVDANNTYNIINDVLNKVQSNTYAFQFTAVKDVPGKYDLRASVSPSYTTREYFIQQEANDNGWAYTLSGSATVELPLKFEIRSDANYQYIGPTASFDQDFKRLIWNAALSKKLLKGDNLLVVLSANDLLDQNKGFSRDVTNSIMTQTSYNTIRRYFMVSMVYDFNKMNKPSK